MNTITSNNISLSKIKKIVFFAFLLLFFLTFNESIPFLLILSNADEIFLAISLIVLFITMINKFTSYKVDRIYFAFIAYFTCQFINYFITPFDLNIVYVLLQSLINIKLFIVALAVLLVYEPSNLNSMIIKYLFYIFVIFFIAGMIANFLLQENWNAIMHYDIRYRYGFIRPAGWFGSSGHNGYFFALTFITILLLYSKKNEICISTFVKKFFLFMIIDFLMAYPLTVRKGLMSNISFGFIIFGKIGSKGKIIFSIVSLFFLLIFLYTIKDIDMVTDTIEEINNSTNNENSYARGLMIYNGYSLFAEFFPFGVGSATFGTALSLYNTRSVYNYVHLNIDDWTGYDGTVHGIFDSGLFSMLAENGFIGMLAIVAFIYYFFKFNEARLDSYNYMIFKTITLFAILLSITEPVWQNGMFTVFYTVNLLFIYTKNGIYRENGKWIKITIY